MRDHKRRRRDSGSPKRVVGVRELKTHAARIVRDVRDAGGSYILTHRGTAVGVILPLEASGDVAQPSQDAEPGAAWDRFLSAGRRLETRFRPGVSGVQILSSGRR